MSQRNFVIMSHWLGASPEIQSALPAFLGPLIKLYWGSNGAHMLLLEAANCFTMLSISSHGQHINNLALKFFTIGSRRSRASTHNLGFCIIFIPPATKLGGVYWIQPVCLSVRLSVCLSVCPLTFSCPPCSIYSSGWILSIFGTNDQ